MKYGIKSKNKGKKTSFEITESIKISEKELDLGELVASYNKSCMINCCTLKLFLYSISMAILLFPVNTKIESIS